MTNDGNGGDDARRRADDAGERARQLRARVIAARDGDGRLHGTSRTDLKAAVARAELATQRLISALESSARAHERAAATYDEQVRRYGDDDGARSERAAGHRKDAAIDRDRAAEIDRA